MPKIYEYKKFHFFFYSREHRPPHCHILSDEREIKAELQDIGGVIFPTYIQISSKKYKPNELRDIKDFVRHYGAKILEKWDIYFEGNKPKCEKINRIPKRKKGLKKSG